MKNYLQFGKYATDCPQWLLDKIKKNNIITVDENFINNVLKIIKDEFNSEKHEITKTNIFEQSRFITTKDVLAKRQRSCGSMATVVASVLRSLNIPTKLIDGKFIKNNPRMQHAWNEVLINNEWMVFDITQKDFKLTEYHIREGEYSDWSELEKI